jgi:Ca2+/Na+ antiporter
LLVVASGTVFVLHKTIGCAMNIINTVFKVIVMQPKYATPHTLPSSTINLFFIVGLLAAFSFRILIVLPHFQPELFRPVWYLGTIGYVMFFLYRYAISRKRRNTIEDYALIPKLKQRKMLSDDERQAVVYLLSSIRKSRENLNYLFIFLLSILAIGIDILLSL